MLKIVGHGQDHIRYKVVKCWFGGQGFKFIL